MEMLSNLCVGSRATTVFGPKIFVFGIGRQIGIVRAAEAISEIFQQARGWNDWLRLQREI